MKRFKLPILTAIAFVLVSLFILTRFTGVSTTYCATCHHKEAALFKTSFTHNTENSRCVDCHDPSYMNPSKHFSSDAEFIDKKCEGCHPDIKKSKEVKKKKIVKMHHLGHMDGKKTNMKCHECHSNIAHDMGSYATNRPGMVGCFAGECHKKERDLKKCDYCHFVKMKFPEKSK